MKNTKGFTLFEVLIGITIGSLLLGLVLSIYSLTTRSLASSQNRSELANNSRIIIDRLTRDLRQARQIATPLPTVSNDPNLSPPNEIEVQDGHNTNSIRYARYYLAGTNLKRQIREYYFPAEPEILVTFDAVDDFSNPASVRIIEDELVGQHITGLAFYGINLITVELQLTKGQIVHTTATQFYGRNL